MYCPVVLIVPVPALASPPARDHVTGAAPPPANVAANWCIALPWASVALHPVQFVSMVDTTGETENAGTTGFPVTGPAPHPASTTFSGANTSLSRPYPGL